MTSHELEILRNKLLDNKPYWLFIGFIVLIIISMRSYQFIRVFGTNLVVMDPFWFIFTVFVLLKSYFWKIDLLKTPLTKLWMLNFLYAIIIIFFSLFVKGNDTMSIFGGFRKIYLYSSIFFIAYYYLGDKENLVALQKILFYMLFVMIPFAIITYITGIWSSGGNYFQFFDHFEGWIFTYFIFLGFSNYLLNHDKKYYYIILAVISSIILFLTAKRGLWLSVIVSLCITYFLSINKITIRSLLKTVAITSLIILFLYFAISFVIQFTAPKLADEITARWNLTIQNIENPIASGSSEGGSIAWRVNLYLQGINYFVQDPILGKGLGFKPVFIIPKEQETFNAVDDLRFHNAYLEVGVQTGIVGLILFLMLHFKFSRIIYKKIKHSNIPKDPKVIGFYSMYLCGMMWAATANTLTSYANFILMIYIIMALLLKETKINEQING